MLILPVFSSPFPIWFLCWFVVVVVFPDVILWSGQMHWTNEKFNDTRNISSIFCNSSRSFAPWLGMCWLVVTLWMRDGEYSMKCEALPQIQSALLSLNKDWSSRKEGTQSMTEFVKGRSVLYLTETVKMPWVFRILCSFEGEGRHSLIFLF